MLSQNTIQTIAKKLQTTQLNIRREYVQHLLLSYLYKENQSDKFLFKGGTALRIIYDSPRFSEDLDFSTSIRNTQRIENMMLAALGEIEREGIQTEIRESKKTTGGHLGIVTFHLQEEVLDVQLEISQRQNVKKGELVTVAGDFIPPYTIVRLPQIVKTIPSVDIDFKQELEKFLPQSHRSIIRDFKQNLLQEIRRFI